MRGSERVDEPLSRIGNDEPADRPVIAVATEGGNDSISGIPAHYPPVISVTAPPPPGLHRLDTHPGRVYTAHHSDQYDETRPEPDRDQVTQAVSVGLCFTMAAVLLVLAVAM